MLKYPVYSPYHGPYHRKAGGIVIHCILTNSHRVERGLYINADIGLINFIHSFIKITYCYQQRLPILLIRHASLFFTTHLLNTLRYIMLMTIPAYSKSIPIITINLTAGRMSSLSSKTQIPSIYETGACPEASMVSTVEYSTTLSSPTSTHH